MDYVPFIMKNPRPFRVSPAKQMYYCFGCGAGGNVFNFVMEYENFTFPEAVKISCRQGRRQAAGAGVFKREHGSGRFKDAFCLR